MGTPISLATTLPAQGSTALLWACIALLVALSLTLVVFSIIFGGKRRRPSVRSAWRAHTAQKERMKRK